MTVVLLLCRCCLFLFRMYRGYRATTVGIRYGVARKQFSMRPHVPDGGLGSGPSEDESKAGVETSILDYPLYQRRIVPLLSQAYALYFTGKFMIKLYSQFQSVRCDCQRQCYNEGVSMLRLCWQNLNKSNDFSLLPELHAASAGLKSWCTSMAAEGVETCRRVRERGGRLGVWRGSRSPRQSLISWAHCAGVRWSRLLHVQWSR